MTEMNATDRSASRDDGMVRPTIGMMLGNRTVRAMLSEVRLEQKRRHMMSLDEIEAAYALSENGISSVLLRAVKKTRCVHFLDLATNEGEMVELHDN